MARNGTKTGGGSRKGKPNKNTAAVQAIARAFVDDPEYRAALRGRLLEGTAGSMEVTLWAYAYGRPAITSGEGELPVRIEIHF